MDPAFYICSSTSSLMGLLPPDLNASCFGGLRLCGPNAIILYWVILQWARHRYWPLRYPLPLPFLILTNLCGLTIRHSLQISDGFFMIAGAANLNFVISVSLLLVLGTSCIK
ncbi:hypothetical protein SLE2022_384570 [Rubroshorea leprosula]